MTLLSTDKSAEAQQHFSKMPRFDISNEAWREYDYGNGKVLRVVGAHTMILDKRPDGDRHRLILKEYPSTAAPDPNEREIGMYVTPGWVGIRWQDHNGKHGITF